MDWSSVMSGTETGAAVGTSVEPGYGTAIGAGVGFLGSMIGSLFQNHLNQNAIDAQNAYNTPSAQMARLKAAGLNPALMYGGGSASAGNQPVAVQFGIPDTDPYTHADKVLALKSAQNQVAIQDLQRKGLSINNEDASRDLILKNWLLDQEQQKIDEGWHKKMRDANLSVLQEEVRKKIAEIGTEGMRKQSVAEDVNLKKQVGNEKEYMQQLRKFGMEKGDPAAILKLLLLNLNKIGN